MFGSEMFQQWAVGFNAILSFDILFYILLGTFLGIVVGAIPGLTSGMATAILLPVAFFMAPLNALVFLGAIYVSCMYGALLTAILLNTPGAPEASATTLDGYPMTKQGKASEALGYGIGASATGGLISYMVFLVAMYPVAKFALKFGPSELFLVAMFGIIVVASLKGEAFHKGLLAAALGLLLGTIGIAATGEWRATFGNIYLAEGVQIIPSLIGLFAAAELLYMAERKFVMPSGKAEKQSFGRILVSMRGIFRHPFVIARAAVVGITIGAIPAAGGTVAALVSYSEAKRSSKHPEKFGTGCPEGIIAAETANNASTGGALMTTLAIGIPGSTTTAIILGALIMLGLRPGPRLLVEQGEIVYGLIMALIFSQGLMVLMAAFVGHRFAGLLRVPTHILVPVILVFCMVGSFAIRNSMFDVYLMFAFGILGWIMRKYDYPPIAVVMGIVLGPIADEQLLLTRMRFGDAYYLAFFTRPISLALVILTIIVVLRPYLGKYLSPLGKYFHHKRESKH